MTVRMEFHGDRVKAASRRAKRGALQAGAELILARSNEYVPLEEGTLERSGTVTVDGDQAAVSYDTVYARRQHEELTWRHAPGRSAKYLERAMIERGGAAVELVAARIRAAMRG